VDYRSVEITSAFAHLPQKGEYRKGIYANRDDFKFKKSFRLGRRNFQASLWVYARTNVMHVCERNVCTMRKERRQRNVVELFCEKHR